MIGPYRRLIGDHEEGKPDRHRQSCPQFDQNIPKLDLHNRKTSLQKSETKMQPARLKRAPASRMLFSAPACEARRRPAPYPPRSGLIVDLRDQAGRPESESDR